MTENMVPMFRGPDSDLRAVHKSIEKNSRRASSQYVRVPSKKFGNRRARTNMAWTEPVSARAVFHRDNWTCQLCGLPCLMPGRSGPEEQSPTVDHVVPLSRGGAHAMWNVVCAHRGCNMDKGNSPEHVDISLLLRIVGSRVDNAPTSSPRFVDTARQRHVELASPTRPTGKYPTKLVGKPVERVPAGVVVHCPVERRTCQWECLSSVHCVPTAPAEPDPVIPPMPAQRELWEELKQIGRPAKTRRSSKPPPKPTRKVYCIEDRSGRCRVGCLESRFCRAYLHPDQPNQRNTL